MGDHGASEAASYHLAEYGALRAEMLQKISSNDDLEKQSLLGAAAVYAWVLTQTDLEQEMRITILVLPFFLVFLNWLRAKATGRQIGLLGRYLEALEKEYGTDIEVQVDHGDKAMKVKGWESAFRKLKLELDRSWIDRNLFKSARHSELRWRAYCVLTAGYPIYEVVRDLRTAIGAEI